MDQLKEVEAILFDLGGVIVDLDWSRTNRAFRRLVPPSEASRADRALEAIFTNQALHEYERGEISWDTFRTRLATDVGIEASEDQFLAAWNEMLLEIPRERIVRMEELKNRYRLGILSNTNERHIDSVNGYLKRSHGIETIDSLVHTPLYSHLVRMRKPEPRVYAHAVAALGVPPERILFIDDNSDNAAAASAAGLVGYHLDLERETVLDVLKRFE